MCGIVGVVSQQPVNQLIYDALLLLQHRGQDAAGIVTQVDKRFYMHKAKGMVRDVFRTRNMRALPGQVGLGQVRYPTAGRADSEEEAQPFYVNAPFGIIMVHNGNLTNADALRHDLFESDHRHLNTSSDSEVLINVFAHELDNASRGNTLQVEDIFKAVKGVHRRVQGSYAVLALIAGYGLLAFRDPHGIRPLSLGRNAEGDYMFASETAALNGTTFFHERDVAPGEAVFVDKSGALHQRQCSAIARHVPCVFEYIYLARPDSEIDGISVYQARLNLGESLAKRVAEKIPTDEIDVVIPIPESSRPSAMQLAHALSKPYREGFVKNRYVGRTFIMPGQATRKKSVRQKLAAVRSEFEGKNVLLVDDSIVRGTTSKEIVQMAREAGAKKVYLASAAPPVRYRNIYGIDMPTQKELVAYDRTEEEVQEQIGCDTLVYQDVQAMKDAVAALSDTIDQFEASCFDGVYLTALPEVSGTSDANSSGSGDAANEKKPQEWQDSAFASGSRLTLPNASA